jgi:hypothetical protein
VSALIDGLKIGLPLKRTADVAAEMGLRFSRYIHVPMIGPRATASRRDNKSDASVAAAEF